MRGGLHGDLGGDVGGDVGGDLESDLDGDLALGGDLILGGDLHGDLGQGDLDGDPRAHGHLEGDLGGDLTVHGSQHGDLDGDLDGDLGGDHLRYIYTTNLRFFMKVRLGNRDHETQETRNCYITYKYIYMGVSILFVVFILTKKTFRTKP